MVAKIVPFVKSVRKTTANLPFDTDCDPGDETPINPEDIATLKKQFNGVLDAIKAELDSLEDDEDG